MAWNRQMSRSSSKKSCITYQQNALDLPAQHVLWNALDQAWERIHIGYTDLKSHMILTFVDAKWCDKMLRSLQVNRALTSATIMMLQSLFTRLSFHSTWSATTDLGSVVKNLQNSWTIMASTVFRRYLTTYVRINLFIGQYVQSVQQWKTDLKCCWKQFFDSLPFFLFNYRITF